MWRDSIRLAFNPWRIVMSEEIPTGAIPVFSQAATVTKCDATQMHSHPCCEIVLIEWGSCRVETPRDAFELKKGDLLVIAANTMHNQINHGLCRNSFVTFLAPPQFFSPNTRLLHIQDDPWVPRMMELVSTMCINRAYELCDGIVFSLLKQIKLIEERQQNVNELHPALVKALQLIEADFGREQLIHELPERCGVSPSYLRLLFQRKMGCSPQDYLLNHRMGEARKMLRQQHVEVAEVAQLCGYPNPNYFTRLFRKVHHCSPSEFRLVERLRLDDFIRR